MNNRKWIRDGNSGFSLVELIVVVLILAILSVSLAPQVFKWVNNARVAVDKNALKSVEKAVYVTYADDGIFSTAAGKTVTVIIKNDAADTKIAADSSIKSYTGKTFEEIFNEAAGGTIDDFCFKVPGLEATLLYKDGYLQPEGTVIPEELQGDVAE